MYLLIHLFIYLFIYLFNYLFIYLFIYHSIQHSNECCGEHGCMQVFQQNVTPNLSMQSHRNKVWWMTNGIPATLG